MYEYLKAELEFIYEWIRTNYDKKRVEGLILKEGDYVYLFLRNLYIKRPSKKLDFKKFGPFRIIKKVIISNYEFDLPINIKVRTKVFYVLLLEPILKKVPLEKEVEVEANEEEFEVKEILDS